MSGCHSEDFAGSCCLRFLIDARLFGIDRCQTIPGFCRSVRVGQRLS